MARVEVLVLVVRDILGTYDDELPAFPDDDGMPEALVVAESTPNRALQRRVDRRPFDELPGDVDFVVSRGTLFASAPTVRAVPPSSR